MEARLHGRAQPDHHPAIGRDEPGNAAQPNGSAPSPGFTAYASELEDGSHTLHLVCRKLPPSNNAIWKPRLQRFKGGFRYLGERLSPEAEEYEAWFLQQAAQHLPEFSGWSLELPLLVDIWVYFSGTGHHALKNKSDGRYKQLDVSNRIKFLEDVLAKSLGIGDGQHTDVCSHKREDPQDERVEIFVVQATEEVLQHIPAMAGIYEVGMAQSEDKITICNRHDPSGRKSQHISRVVCLSRPYRYCPRCPNRHFVLVFRGGQDEVQSD
jgi:hypothetical protein